MANIKSQKKRILTNEKARLRNNAVKSELKTAIRAVNTAVASTDKDAAAAALVSASRKLDKAVIDAKQHLQTASNLLIGGGGLRAKGSKLVNLAKQRGFANRRLASESPRGLGQSRVQSLAPGSC